MHLYKPASLAACFLLLISFNGLQISAQSYTLHSPDKQIALRINMNKFLELDVEFQGEYLFDIDRLSMNLDKGQLPAPGSRVIKMEERSVDQVIEAPLSTKFSQIRDHYNLLSLDFKSCRVEFRAYNDGIAYRFITLINGEVKVMNEQVDLDFAEGSSVYYPEEEGLKSHYERTYEYLELSDVEEGSFCSLPFLVENKEGVKILFTESDLADYPGLFMKKKGKESFEALHPKYVQETTPLKGSEDRDEIITKEADYIAVTEGTRSFPWRLAIVGEDKDLIESTLVFRLATHSKVEDPSWIEPGQVAWDWYNALNLTGVNFESGINTATYKFYIDFAARLNIPYIILDEGWSLTTTNITAPKPELDVQELIRYGKERNVRLILWVLWKPLDQDIEGILSTYSDWGVAGIKVDFMQRSDQWMVNYYTRVAAAAAERELMVDYHGAYKPAGLNRTYPNAITFEGVKGNENNKWSQDITPEHNLMLPFIRMAAGPMDYTPGAMANAQLVNHLESFDRPMSLGTRCHELAKYVIYESPLQMLCDAPSAYLKDHESAWFIAKIPTVWDETVVLEAKVGDYLAMARRSGQNWYLAAMTDWTPRDLLLDLDFLPEGMYSMILMRDGANAAKHAEDYSFDRARISSGEKQPIQLAPGGGWVAILVPAE